jgi:hypothetical protein
MRIPLLACVLMTASCISQSEVDRESAASGAASLSHYYAVASLKPLGSPADVRTILEVAHRYTKDYSFDPEIRWISKNEVFVAVKGSILRLRRGPKKSWRVVDSNEYITVG